MSLPRCALLILLAALVSACASTSPVSGRSDASIAVGEQVLAVEEAPPATDETVANAATPVDAGAEATPEDAETAASLAPTDAEQDYAVLYGDSSYDPVADPTLPPGVQATAVFDPWEKFNRRVHAFNNTVDRAVARPLARTYVHVVPRPMRLGVSNFFSNLGQPIGALNALLQGRPKQASQSLARFLMNSTLGIGGIFDPASDAKLPNRNEDFGQTLGVWGWRKSRYLELPFFGPRTVRDAFGMVGDAQISPVRRIESDKVRYGLQGLALVDIRAQLLPLDSLREGASDEYTLTRDAWSQRRQFQIFQDTRRKSDNDTSLPDYLNDEDPDMTVPVDAMPMPEIPAIDN